MSKRGANSTPARQLQQKLKLMDRAAAQASEAVKATAEVDGFVGNIEEELHRKDPSGFFLSPSKFSPEDFDQMRMSMAILLNELDAASARLEVTVQGQAIIRGLLNKQRDMVRDMQRLAKLVGVDLSADG